MNSGLITIGIDPGKKGALVALLNGSEVVRAERTPLVKNSYSLLEMSLLLETVSDQVVRGIAGRSARKSLTGAMDALKEGDDRAAMVLIRSANKDMSAYQGLRITAVLEKQHAERGEGVTSSFTNGMGYGMWQGVLHALHIPFQIVTPTHWMRALGIPKPKVKGDKTEHILACQRLLPEIDLRPGRVRTPHDGLADAALMAVYAYRAREQGLGVDV